jgi:prolyl-tRNA synthetase
MSHSDDNGLVLPPKVAPIHVVLVPIYKTDEERNAVWEEMSKIANDLKAKGIRVKIDNDDTKRPGWKFAEWELKGVPVRIAMGPRDLQNRTCELYRRDDQKKENVSLDGISDRIQQLLEDIQQNLFTKAQERLKNNTFSVDTWEAFQDKIEQGFVLAHWDGTTETELKIKELTKATIRCIPMDSIEEVGTCVLTGKPSNKRVLFAKAY